MKSEDYWVIFSKSGKIEDYLVFRAMKDETDKKVNRNAIKHKGTNT